MPPSLLSKSDTDVFCEDKNQRRRRAKSFSFMSLLLGNNNSFYFSPVVTRASSVHVSLCPASLPAAPERQLELACPVRVSQTRGECVMLEPFRNTHLSSSSACCQWGHSMDSLVAADKNGSKCSFYLYTDKIKDAF